MTPLITIPQVGGCIYCNNNGVENRNGMIEMVWGSCLHLHSSRIWLFQIVFSCLSEQSIFTKTGKSNRYTL